MFNLPYVLGNYSRERRPFHAILAEDSFTTIPYARFVRHNILVFLLGVAFPDQIWEWSANMRDLVLEVEKGVCWFCSTLSVRFVSWTVCLKYVCDTAGSLLTSLSLACAMYATISDPELWFYKAGYPYVTSLSSACALRLMTLIYALTKQALSMWRHDP